MPRLWQTVEYRLLLVQPYFKKPDKKQKIKWTILVLDLKLHPESLYMRNAFGQEGNISASAVVLVSFC
jgi:hypothetical protein